MNTYLKKPLVTMYGARVWNIENWCLSSCNSPNFSTCLWSALNFTCDGVGQAKLGSMYEECPLTRLDYLMSETVVGVVMMASSWLWSVTVKQINVWRVDYLEKLTHHLKDWLSWWLNLKRKTALFYTFHNTSTFH